LRRKGYRLNNVKEIVNLLEDKKAENIKVLDLTSTSSLVSYAIIAEAGNSRLLSAIKDYCVDYAKTIELSLHHVEGNQESDWILIDFGSICVHLFLSQSRNYYRLEDLWLDKLIKL
jgi:ribosome-associated protein